MRGPKGLSGDGLSFAGDWDNATTYTVNDCVAYDNGLWYSLQTNINQTPYEGSAYWELIYRGVTTIYPVSVNPPTVQQDGELWFKILT